MTVGSDCGVHDGCELACEQVLQPGLSECASEIGRGVKGETDVVHGAVEGVIGTGESGEEGEKGKLAGEGDCADYVALPVIPVVTG